VPLKSCAATPTGRGAIQAQFPFCADALQGAVARQLSARAPGQPCAGNSAGEELACHLKMVNARLKDMSARRPDAERVLGERYVVDVERWAAGAREGRALPRCGRAARQFAARDGRLLNLVAWREFTARRSWRASSRPTRRSKCPPDARAAQSLGRRARLHLLRRRGQTASSFTSPTGARATPGLRRDAPEGTTRSS
jgi:hypothetical protein